MEKLRSVDAEDSSIFGLKKGMSVSEIRALEFGDVEQGSENDSFFVNNPKMPSGAAYGGFLVSPSDGLLKVYFIWDVKTNRYGDQLREKYEELRDILKKKYGRGEEYDFLRSDSIWDEPGDYVTALAKGERFLDWFCDRFRAFNKWQLDSVSVKTSAESENIAYVTVTYEFKGWGEYLEALKANEASQF